MHKKFLRTLLIGLGCFPVWLGGPTPVLADETSSTYLEIQNFGRHSVTMKATGYKQTVKIYDWADASNGRVECECTIGPAETKTVRVAFHRESDPREMGMELYFNRMGRGAECVGFHDPSYIGGQDIVQTVHKSTKDESKLVVQSDVRWRFFDGPRDKVFIGLGDNL